MFNSFSKNKRNENEILNDLERVCLSDGYAHVLAYFCFRDNVINYGDEIKKENFESHYDGKGLMRIEISTLIGLACQKMINIDLPKPNQMQKMIEETEKLLAELHESMLPDMSELFKLDENGNIDRNYNPFKEGKFLREPIFYGGESAYHFQYKDLSKIKYTNDEEWIIKNKGYSLSQLIDVIDAIGKLQLKKINNILFEIALKHSNEWTVLDAFIFTVDEIKEELTENIDKEIIEKVIESFVAEEEYSFKEIDDFNPKNAFPIIKINESRFLLFQHYTLLESLYESPFFWFWDDEAYRSQAMKNRGNFTEDFAISRLKSVFGDFKVYQGVNILEKNGKTVVGEIDVLVLFADRAIVLQAKSKKLTISSRKGNDNTLQSDFKKAVQDAYDQAYLCSNFLLEKKYKLEDLNKNEINISNINFRTIYPVCLVSDHYPALFFQARQFLNFQENEVIKPPFIMDVFFLDIFAEMLNTPLHFLSYLERRVCYSASLIANHEMTLLAYHLKQNLWLDDDLDFAMIADDFCAELDMAVLSRRGYIDTVQVPEGILTKSKNTVIGDFISEIENLNNPNTIDFGFLLLKLSQQAMDTINEGIDIISQKTLTDGNNHDFTMAFEEDDGLTIHCNFDDYETARERLESHACKRKYYTKRNNWQAICIDPKTKKIRFGIKLDFPWEYSLEMENLTRNMAIPLKTFNFKTKIRPKKIGRNEKCPCGSGEKYKRCCM